MTDPASSEEAVLEHNRHTFKAEDEPETARELLRDALSEDFSIVRAIGAVQGKQAMIDRVATDTSGNTRRIEQAEARVFGDAAVVLTCLTLLDRTGAEGKQLLEQQDVRASGWRLAVRGMARDGAGTQGHCLCARRRGLRDLTPTPGTRDLLPAETALMRAAIR